VQSSFVVIHLEGVFCLVLTENFKNLKNILDMKKNLFISTLLLASSISFLSQAAPLAFVSNEGSGTISVIDLATNLVINTMETSGKPRGIYASPNSDFVYATEFTKEQLLKIDVPNQKIIQKSSLGKSPEAIYVSKDGKWITVANEDSNSVSIIDASTLNTLIEIPVEGKNPEHAVMSPDSRWVYVSAEEADNLDVIDVNLRKQVGQIKVGKRPRGIGFTPDGSTVIVACEIESKTYLIDVPTKTVKAFINTGLRSNGVSIHPNGKFAYVSNGGDGTVAVIDIEKQTIIKHIPVGKRPWNMDITPDQKKLLVANGRSNSVTVINLESNQAEAEISVGSLPWGVAIK